MSWNDVQVCVWVYNEGWDKWNTDCDNAFIFMAGGPRGNDFVFCPYCGLPIQEQGDD